MVLTFNPFNETWTQQPNMRNGRWYPTLTTLPDGRVTIFSGLDASGNNTVNNDLEVFTPSPDMNGVGTVTYQPTATHTSSIYPHMAVLPSGKVLMAGPDTEAALLNPATWTWQDLPNLPSARNWGSAAILPAPPGRPPEADDHGRRRRRSVQRAQNSTVTIDLNNPAAGWTAGPPMNIAPRPPQHGHPAGQLGARRGRRRGQDAVDGNLYSGRSTVRDPLADHQHVVPGRHPGRGAHLPLHGPAPARRPGLLGRRRPAGPQFTDKGELYSPPYLFKGARPVVDFAPTTVNTTRPSASPSTTRSDHHGASDRPGADTHANDMNQRSIGLSLTNQADGVTLTSPANANIAPPGYYMLYAVNAQGVPSVAKIIKLDPAAPARAAAARRHPAAVGLVHCQPGEPGSRPGRHPDRHLHRPRRHDRRPRLGHGQRRALR